MSVSDRQLRVLPRKVASWCIENENKNLEHMLGKAVTCKGLILAGNCLGTQVVLLLADSKQES